MLRDFMVATVTILMIWLLGGYMWLFIHRPFEVWPVLGDYRIERVYMLLTLTAWATAADKSWTSNRLTLGFVALIVVVLLSWQFSPYSDVGTQTVEEYLKLVVFGVLIMSTIRDEDSLRKLVLLYLIAMGLYMTHSLWEFYNGRHVYRMGIARMVGVDATFDRRRRSRGIAGC
jgi:hypothetical protein